jgi:hypothetical protein
MNYLNSQFEKSYREINKNVVSDSIRYLMVVERELNFKLIEDLPELVRFKDWQSKKVEDWLNRNSIMTKNILGFSELTKARKVVVLTGLLHKYILKDLLSSSNTDGKYELVEYFEK